MLYHSFGGLTYISRCIDSLRKYASSTSTVVLENPRKATILISGRMIACCDFAKFFLTVSFASSSSPCEHILAFTVLFQELSDFILYTTCEPTMFASCSVLSSSTSSYASHQFDSFSDFNTSFSTHDGANPRLRC